MDTTSLLEKLIDIERAIRTKDSATVHSMVLDAEEYILQAQRQKAEVFRRGSWLMRLL